MTHEPALSRRKPRLLIVVRDRFPLVRVDLSELFGRWLTPIVEIDWVAAREGPGGAEVVAGGSGERFMVSAACWPSWLMVQAVQGFRAARGGVDLVQVRDAALSAAVFLVMAKIGRRPFVYWMSYPIAEGYLHRARSGGGLRGLPRRMVRLIYGTAAIWLLYRVILPRADHVFVQSERMKMDVAARGVRLERLTAVPMGVSLDAYASVEPARDPRLQARKSLVYVGAFDPERNIAVLVDALAAVIRAGIDAMLTIVGGGADADRRSLIAAATTAGVQDRLVFTGRLQLAEAFAYMRAADVCLGLFPLWPDTYRSATPTKLVEYLAMGRPVVASDHPDQRHVIKESGAGVIAPSTADGFAAAIIGLIQDPATAEAMGARGPAWVAAHRDYAVISRRVAEVYERLLGRSGA